LTARWRSGGADAECQTPPAPAFSGAFRAWLADRSSSPATRFTRRRCLTCEPMARSRPELERRSTHARAPSLDEAVVDRSGADCGPAV
jgi:hypothetical protein